MSTSKNIYNTSLATITQLEIHSESGTLPVHPLFSLLLNTMRNICTYRILANELESWLCLLVNPDCPRMLITELTRLASYSSADSIAHWNYSHPSTPLVMMEMESEESRGFAGIFIPTLASNDEYMWPPMGGYSVSMWIYIDRIELGLKQESYEALREQEICISCGRGWREPHEVSCGHIFCKSCIIVRQEHGKGCSVCQPPSIVLFGIHGLQSKCFFELLLEPTEDGRALMPVAQLSQNSKQNIAFSSIHFLEKRWYHIVFTHQKYRIFQPASATIFVNGVHFESQKISYPNACSASQLSIYIGTPPAYACLNPFRWSIGPVMMFEDVMTQVMANAIFCLGSNYCGSFFGEDSQKELVFTYTFLDGDNINGLHEAKKGQGVIYTQHRSDQRLLRNPTLYFEWASDRLVFAFSAHSAVEVPCHSSNHNQRTLLFEQVARLLDKVKKGLFEVESEWHKSNHTLYVLCNAASSSAAPTPLAFLEGGSTPLSKRGVADTLCGIGGIRLLFPLLDRSATSDELIISLELLFAMLRGNLRNLREMDHTDGYSALLHILKQKTHLQSTKSMAVLFAMAGLREPVTGSGMGSPKWGRGETIVDLRACQILLDYRFGIKKNLAKMNKIQE